jgi:acetyltransferase
MSFLNPTSVAVIGASSVEGKVGHDILKNLLTQGFAGAVYPVNPKNEDILGTKTYQSVEEIPGSVDLAIIVIPAAHVPQALTQCGAKKIKSVIVISAGFSEVHTDEGKKLEEELGQIAKKYDIELLGPNCLGVIQPATKMNASFAKDLPPGGPTALISQSGALAVGLMDAAATHGIGFSAVFSIGNKLQLDETAVLELCLADPATKVIGLYLESIKDGRAFLQQAARVARTKPIVLLKAGVSEHGKQAASSHTGALAGSDAAVQALCTQAGIARAQTSEEFFDLLAALSTQPKLLSNRIAIVTNAGGPGILATDAAEAHKLQMPSLNLQNESTLHAALPAAASTHNPIDVIGDAGAERYQAALVACREDSNIDGVVVIVTPQVMTPCEQIAQTIVDVMKENPLMPVVACFMGGETVKGAKELLRKNGIPVFETPERAVHAMKTLHSFFSQGEKRTKSAPSPIRTPPALSFLTNASKASAFVRHEADAQGSPVTPRGAGPLLDEKQTEILFSHYNLPMPRQVLAKSAEEAVMIAQQIGYPVIAKVSAPSILHKTDVGGVRANLQTKEDVLRAYTEITKNVAGTQIDGILIQQFLPVGNEFIVGGLRDASCGPLVMVGLGGIYTELFRDTAFRLAPIEDSEAYAMLQELKAWKLLLGMRGARQSDIATLAKLIVNVSRMMWECPQIRELDLNPVLVSSDSVVIADAKVIL